MNILEILLQNAFYSPFYYFHFPLKYTAKDLLDIPEPIEEATEKTMALIGSILGFCCCLANYIKLVV